MRLWENLPIPKAVRAEDQFRNSFAMMAGSLRAQANNMRADPAVPTIESPAKIPLDIVCKPITPEDWLFIGNEDGVRMIYIDLKAPTSTSYEAKHVKNLLLSKKRKLD